MTALKGRAVEPSAMSAPWTEEDARSWTAALDSTGEVLVRARFWNGAPVLDNPKLEPPTAFIAQWLNDRGRRRAGMTIWRVILFAVGFIAAAAAVIAVWLAKK